MFLGKQWVVKDPGEARGGNDPEGALGGVNDPWVGGRGFTNDWTNPAEVLGGSGGENVSDDVTGVGIGVVKDPIGALVGVDDPEEATGGVKDPGEARGGENVPGEAMGGVNDPGGAPVGVKDPGEAKGGKDPEGAMGGVNDPWVGGRGFTNDPELGGVVSMNYEGEGFVRMTQMEEGVVLKIQV